MAVLSRESKEDKEEFWKKALFQIKDYHTAIKMIELTKKE